ncbi:hypothetical protein BH24ACT15_BH24ACT15_36610 [soil metagenome]
MTTPAQEAFDALADPTRRAILEHLAEHQEMSSGDIADRIGAVGRTAVSSHLRILRTAGLVTERRDGRFRLYSLQPDGPIRDAVVFLQAILEFALPSVPDDSRHALPPEAQGRLTG